MMGSLGSSSCLGPEHQEWGHLSSGGGGYHRAARSQCSGQEVWEQMGEWPKWWFGGEGWTLLLRVFSHGFSGLQPWAWLGLSVHLSRVQQGDCLWPRSPAAALGFS